MIGETLGHYKILGLLGRGGMGEVYRAQDTKLGREVAIKILPRELSSSKALQRFEREARLLASLNHRGVATVHGFESESDPPFLVMELLAGEDLARHLKRGPLPTQRALEAASSVAAALQAAHENGIVHRDLKPANIMLLPEGNLKVMDFGLARVVEVATDRAEMASLETIPLERTGEGTLMGTTPYMSPEQLTKQNVDARTDVWAFGCLLYEMLTGKLAFGGRTLADCVAAILERDPDWSALPSDLPPMGRWVLKRCLEKNPANRLQTMADVRWALKDAAGGTYAGALLAEQSGHRRKRTRSVVAWSLAALFGILALYLGLDRPPTMELTQSSRTAVLDVALPSMTTWQGPSSGTLAVSPDGTSIVYTIQEKSGTKLHLKRLDAREARDLPGTENANNPFFSPDGSFLGFTVDDAIRCMKLPDGVPRTVVEGIHGTFSGTPSWGQGDRILYATTAVDAPALFLVASDGGEPRKLAANEEGWGTNPGWPCFLPDGSRFLFVRSSKEGTVPQLYLGSIDGSEFQALEDVHSRAAYVSPGYVLYVQGKNLTARRFDPKKGRWAGEPVSLGLSVSRFVGTGKADFAASPSLVVGVSSPWAAKLVWYDRSGRRLNEITDWGDLSDPRISPSADRVAYQFADPSTGLEDLWIYDIEHRVSKRLTFTPQIEEGYPVWSPDGQRIAFYSARKGYPDLRVLPANGSGQEKLILEKNDALFPTDWSPDGKSLIYWRLSDHDLWIVPLSGTSPRPFVQAKGTQAEARYSPGGKYIAFSSTEYGDAEVFLAPCTDGSQRVRVSFGGGSNPCWDSNGHGLYYSSRRSMMFVKNVIANPADAMALFEIPQPMRIHRFDLTPDGKRFLLAVVDSSHTTTQATVMMNWQSALAQH